MIKMEHIKEVLEKIEEKQNEERKATRLVNVNFGYGQDLCYLSDMENIEVGDLVTVEGKKEDEIGVVKTVRKSFKIPKFEMKWIESVINRDVSGNYFKLDEDMVSLDATLTAEQFISMSIGMKYKDNQAIGEEELDVDLENFEENELFENELVKIRGKELYKAKAVKFISLQDGVGKAIVRGGEWYEIDFGYANGKITYLACECPYFEECKHEIALLYKLRELLKKLAKKTNKENFVICAKDYFGGILSLGKGRITLEL